MSGFRGMTFQKSLIAFSSERSFYSKAELDAAVAAEREACAKVCESEAREWDSDDVVTEKNYAAHCATVIRARGAA